MNNKKTTALWSFVALMGWSLGTAGAQAAAARPAGQQDQAAPQNAGGQRAQAGTAKTPQWGSREEYDAFQAMLKESDPNKKVSLADAFLQKYPKSDFKDQADLIKVQAYQQLNDAPHAMQAAHDALQVNPENVGALNYLSFAFPFVFKATDANKDAELSDAEANAKKGLEVLQKTQKPDNVPQGQFDAQVKQLRANFNGAMGFVALQRKDYATAITGLQAAQEDNPSDPYIAYRLGLSYMNSSPPDFNNAIWYLARATSQAKAAKIPDADAIQKYYGQVYEGRHGSNVGENDVVAQAASSPTPPPGFNVAPEEKHKATGNAFLDAFYGYEDNLKAGGDTADKAWAGLKGQALGGPGWVAGVEKGDGGYIVHVNITSDAQAKDGAYDIELKDNSQPDCKDLAKGDPVRVQGSISAYTLTPSFVLTLDNGKINQESLAAAAARAEAERKKNEPKHRTSHRTDQ